MQVTYNGNTFVLDSTNINDTNKEAGCPSKSAIVFTSKVCRYDINTAKEISNFSGTITNTGSIIFSGSTASGIQLNSSGMLILTSLTGASRVSIPTSLTISSSGTWDGYFIAPEQTNASGSLNLTGYARLDSLTYRI